MLKEVFVSSLPLGVIILVVCGFVAPLNSTEEYSKLLVAYLSVVVGQTLFLVGLDSSILPIGKIVGRSLIKLRKVSLIVFCGFLFGLLVTVAEPALEVLARQTNMIMPEVSIRIFVWIASLGIGLSVGFALLRVMKNWPLKKVFAWLYGLIFLLVIFVPGDFVGLAFDASGATTGDVSVPFILALGIGVSKTMSKHRTNEDTFGVIGISSVGPILAVFIYGLILKHHPSITLSDAQFYDPSVSQTFRQILIGNFKDVAFALVPIVVAFIPFQFMIKLSKSELTRILLGLVPVYVGLLIFLTGIDYGFAFAGKYIGEIFLESGRWGWLLVVGFGLGIAITLSEPAVTVLGDQLEELTNGHIKKQTIRLTLALGIGFATVLAILKIITQINILWFLAPLYLVALIMMRYTSNLFVGLAFDSGGVTGGALTSAFLTPLTLGVAQAVADTSSQPQSILMNGFGVIAFISVTPLIAVQVLGLLYERRAALSRASDELELDSLEGLFEEERGKADYEG